MAICDHCNQPLKEFSRNETYVFYKCGCHNNKGVEWDWQHLLHKGKEYLMGRAGSIAHECPLCHQLTFRMNQFSEETCLYCGKAKIAPIEFRA